MGEALEIAGAKTDVYIGQWKTQPIGNDRYKVPLNLAQVRSLAHENGLVIRSGWAFRAGDVLEIAGVEVDVHKVKYLMRREFGHFNWKLWISGDFVPELREKLVLQVKGGDIRP